jgi:DNA-binding transcriptional LysR family regulator
MEFRELAAFVAIVEEGGLSAASRRLHVSQPALSQTVNNLERELAVTLLVRSSTGAQPTETGITFLVEARAVLARRDQAVATMAELTAGGDSVIRLAIPLELDPDVLPPALARFTSKFPEARVVRAGCPRPRSSRRCVMTRSTSDLCASARQVPSSTRCWCPGRTSAF